MKKYLSHLPHILEVFCYSVIGNMAITNNSTTEDVKRSLVLALIAAAHKTLSEMRAPEALPPVVEVTTAPAPVDPGISAEDGGFDIQQDDHQNDVP